MDRIAEVKRVTKETNIDMRLDLDGRGRSSVKIGRAHV